MGCRLCWMADSQMSGETKIQNGCNTLGGVTEEVPAKRTWVGDSITSWLQRKLCPIVGKLKSGWMCMAQITVQ